MSKTMKENDHKLGSAAEFMSTLIQAGPRWKGFDQVKHFIVFGASYCDVGYSHRETHPTPERPLGVDFPGDTYNEPGKPNWVGHLVTMGNNFLVHDYGKGGAMVDGVRYQVETEFLPHAGQKPDWAAWNESNSLFSTWVGINDCAYIREPAKVKGSIDELFLTQEKLYEAGARNYVFVNVPPIDRSPAVGDRRMPSSAQVFKAWNTQLLARAKAFAALHSDATVIIYSSWATFNRVLDDPTAYGFAPGSERKEGGDIWFDQLHPTSAMHEIIAKDLLELLHGRTSNDLEVTSESEDTAASQASQRLERLSFTSQ